MPRELDDAAPLPARTLGRTAVAVPPVFWECSGHMAPGVFDACHAIAARWLIIPSDAPGLVPMGDWSIVLSIPVVALRPRGSRAVPDSLARIGLSRCAAVLLKDLDPDDAKAGWPFHRLAQLRERGLVEWSYVEAPDAATAEWLVEHTPAHAVIVPLSITDQSAKYRVLPAGSELGTAILARLTEAASIDEVRWAAADEQLAAIVCPLPTSARGVAMVADAIRHPLDAEARQALWTEFQQRVPPPPRPRGAHPPEFGA